MWLWSDSEQKMSFIKKSAEQTLEDRAYDPSNPSIFYLPIIDHY